MPASRSCTTPSTPRSNNQKQNYGFLDLDFLGANSAISASFQFFEFFERENEKNLGTVKSSGNKDDEERSVGSSDSGEIKEKRLKEITPYQRTLQNSFHIIKQVGAGTFGAVYKAKDNLDNGFVALKKIHVHIANEGFPITALREVKILQKLNHENVVNLREVVPSNLRNDGLSTSCMVFDYMDYDLTGLLENKAVVLDEGQVKCLMKQLLEGLYFCHTNKVMHRDLKAANLLLDATGTLKIADWGLARSWVKNFKYTTRVVTLWYRPPELLLGLKHYDLKIDIWAVGCIFAEFLERRAVLPGQDETDQLNLIFQLCGTPTETTWPWLFKYYSKTNKSFTFAPLEGTIEARYGHLPPLAFDLFKKMLMLDPAKRISAEEALDHDFFWKEGTVDSKEALITKIRNQIGDHAFKQGLHEYEIKAKTTAVQEPFIPPGNRRRRRFSSDNNGANNDNQEQAAHYSSSKKQKMRRFSSAKENGSAVSVRTRPRLGSLSDEKSRFKDRNKQSYVPY